MSGLEQLLKALTDNEVKFIVVGAYAAIAHGSTLCIRCKVASLGTIIRSKEAADRPKDRATLPELKALRMIQQREKGRQS